MLKFGQKEFPAKGFYGQRHISDMFTTDINKVVISDKVPLNNGKDCRYIVGYKHDNALIPLFIKMPKNIFCHGVSQYDKRYFHGKLKTCKERIKTNFHGQNVPYDMHYNEMLVLKINPVYKQDKNYHPQAYVEECKYTIAEKEQCNMLSDNDDGFFEV